MKYVVYGVEKETKLYAALNLQLLHGEERNVIVQVGIAHVVGQEVIQRKSIPLRGGGPEQGEEGIQIKLKNIYKKNSR